MLFNPEAEEINPWFALVPEFEPVLLGESWPGQRPCWPPAAGNWSPYGVMLLLPGLWGQRNLSSNVDFCP